MRITRRVFLYIKIEMRIARHISLDYKRPIWQTHYWFCYLRYPNIGLILLSPIHYVTSSSASHPAHCSWGMDAPMNLLTMLPTRPPGLESEAGASRGMAGLTALISCRRGAATWVPCRRALARTPRMQRRRLTWGWGSGRVWPPRRGAAHKSRIWRRGVGATSSGEEEVGCSC
jgi:hypothetical protein